MFTKTLAEIAPGDIKPGLVIAGFEKFTDFDVFESALAQTMASLLAPKYSEYKGG